MLTNYGATAVTGQIDGAGSFARASSQYMKIEGPNGLATDEDHTVEAWIKPTDWNENNTYSQRAVARSSGSVSDGYNLGYPLDEGNGFYFSEWISDSEYRAGHWDATYTAGVWYHVVATFNSTNQAVTIYINGSSVSNNMSGSENNKASGNETTLTFGGVMTRLMHI